MAIYHLEGQIISRSQGRTATAACAYRSCSTIYDEQTGLTHNFEKKSPDLVASEILLPDNAPKAFLDRQTLWNAVEKKENRKDSQLCREFNISLPRELSNDENWDLAKSFVQKEFVNRGMIADLNFHRGHKSQEEQPHIHVMLTMREVTPDGFGQKNRDWNDRGLLQEWRESWAKHVNERFQNLGIDMRIDHRTLEEQGIDLEPQSKIGAKSALEKMARFEEHKDIAKENGQRIIEDPSIILKAITNQQSTFTHQDIARVVNRYTVDEQQFKEAYSKVMAHPELTALGKDQKNLDRYTTQTMLATEKALIGDAIALSERSHHKIDETIQESVRDTYQLSDAQKHAFNYLVDDGDMRNLIGIAGSGKSYLLGAVRQAHEEQGYRVIGMTMAGKASENLEQSSGIASRTVASYIASWDSGRDLLDKKDIVVIDEAGMLGSLQYARLLHEANKHGAKVITAFDSEQLQAITAGAAARSVADHTGFIGLREVRRQEADWQKQATVHFSEGMTKGGLDHYASHHCVHEHATADQSMRALLDQWQEIRSSQPDKEQLILAYTRLEVKQLNGSARAILKADDILMNPKSIATSDGIREFCEGDRVYFLKNEYKDMNVKNGSLGTIEKLEDHSMAVRLDSDAKDKDGRLVQVDLKTYNHLDHGYATTIHKSQGTSVDYTHVLASRHFDRHLTYVAMTRHKLGANLYWNNEDFKSFNQLGVLLSRERTKDFTLDYIKNQYQEERAGQSPSDVKEKDSHQTPTSTAQSMEDRMRQAQQRLEKRAFDQEVLKIAQHVGLQLSDQVKSGDVGIFKGDFKINGIDYAVIQTSSQEGKIMYCGLFDDNIRINKKISVVVTKDFSGRDALGAEIFKEKQKEQIHDPEKSIPKAHVVEVEKTMQQERAMGVERVLQKTKVREREIDMGER